MPIILAMDDEENNCQITTFGQQYYCQTRNCYKIVCKPGERCFSCNEQKGLIPKTALSPAVILMALPTVILLIWAFWK